MLMKVKRRSSAAWTATGALALALLSALVLVAAASAAEPKTTSPPTIEGQFQVGNTVGASTGSWDNNPQSYSYQWQRCDKNGANCKDISGATSKSYKLDNDDVGNTVRVLVTAKNDDGQSTANSKPSPVVAGNEAPSNTTRPSISGTAQVGEELRVDNGKWNGVVRSYSYQWQRCDQSGGECSNIQGATAQTYGVRSADKGKTLRVTVTAKNASGQTSVTSDRSQVVGGGSSSNGNGNANSSQSGSSCSNANGPIDATKLSLPVRLLIDRWQFNPNVVTTSTGSFTARIHVSDTCGRSVSNAKVWSTAIPYNQTNVVTGTTDGNGWATLQFNIQQGFPANPGKQQILAMLVRATKPGGSALAGVSTRRTLRQNVRVTQ